MYDAKTVAAVLEAKAQGATHEQAAAAGGVSVKTVANMLERIGRTKKRPRAAKIKRAM